jgi:hypothetical protein
MAFLKVAAGILERTWSPNPKALLREHIEDAIGWTWKIRKNLEARITKEIAG